MWLLLNSSLNKVSSLNDANTLLTLGVYYGQGVGLPKNIMKSFILGVWKDCNIINLSKTLISLETTLNLIFKTITKGDKILFITNKRVNLEAISSWMYSTNQYCINKSIGGILSNWSTFKNSQLRANSYQEKALLFKNKRMSNTYFKKAIDAVYIFKGSAKLNECPKIIILFCNDEKSTVIKEANLLNIPVIGIASEYMNVQGINHIIPISNNSRLADILICRLLCNISAAADMGHWKTQIINKVQIEHISKYDLRIDYRLYIACLQFKHMFLDEADLDNIFTLHASKKLELKFVLKYLFQLKVSSNFTLRYIINTLKSKLIHCLNSKTEYKQVLTLSMLIKNLEIIFVLARKKKITHYALSFKCNNVDLKGKNVNLFMPKQNHYIGYHKKFYLIKNINKTILYSYNHNM